MTISAYAINKVCWLAGRDSDFRQRLRIDPHDTLTRFTPPLGVEATAAFLSGDVAALSAMGANRYLLVGIARQRLFGLDRSSYVARLRAAYEADPKGRTDIAG